VTSIETTVPILTQQLKGTPWFDVVKFPDATFTSTKVTETSTTTALITGSLTLHGITKLETLRAQLVGSGVNQM
jgi:polyisoprenoid-binding protein YceI